MTATTMARPTGTFPGFDLPDWAAHVVKRPSPTNLNTDIITREIAEVIAAWDAGTLNAVEVAPEFPQDPVEAVAFIKELLGVSQDDVLNAVGVKERTFFGWKQEGRRPRTDSLGALWPMVQVVGRLNDIHPSLTAWFHTSDTAQIAFRAGDVNGLVMAELDFNRRMFPSAPMFVPADDTHTDDEHTETPTRTRVGFTSEDVDEVLLPASRPPGNDE
ncbi:MAG: hypothetical protein GC157_04815 [Frankiales bacterium]|nr:hypothetical protein [Frankiales bacterium]